MGILVIPPTNKTSSILSFDNPESFKQFSNGFMLLYMRSEQMFSNLDLVILNYKCLGPFWSAERYAKLISV